eukprot:5671338-Prymnesium_polylepis.1
MAGSIRELPGQARAAIITYALLSPPPARPVPVPPVPRVNRHGIGVDPSKRSAPGFAVSGGCVAR